MGGGRKLSFGGQPTIWFLNFIRSWGKTQSFLVDLELEAGTQFVCNTGSDNVYYCGQAVDG
jgi:hypothetical protein